MMKKKLVKKYIVSSLITFAAAFAIVILPDIEKLTVESLNNGAVIGLLFVGLRAGIKAVLEAFVAWYSTR